PAPADAAEAKVPFWQKDLGGKNKGSAASGELSIRKKEITFSRKPNAEDAAAKPAGESVPFWKKDLSFSRKAKPAAAAAATTVAAAAPVAAEAKVPFWKKE